MTVIAKMGRSPYGLDVDRPTRWWTQAACRGHDPELWSHLRGWRSLPSPDHKVSLHASEARAVAICNSCPVTEHCYREAATAYPPTAGVIRAGLFWPLRPALKGPSLK